VRTRIVGLAVFASIMAIAMFGAPLAAIVLRYAIDDERNELERVADLAAVSVAVDLARGQHPDSLPTDRDAGTLAVYAPTGERIVGDGPAVADAMTAKAHDRIIRSTDERGDIVVAVPIATDTALLGVVRASTPRTETTTQITVAWLCMAGFGLIAVITVWFVARSMAARLSRPLEQLALTAHALGNGDFSTRFQPGGIAEIDTVVAALNTTAARLSDLVARERSFSSDASHQLRTPLTALRLGLEVALEAPGQDLAEAVGNAIADTDRLQRIVEDLLALARNATRHSEPLALPLLLDELAQTWRPQLAQQHRTLEVTVQPHTPVSDASTAAVRQILAVLIDNATSHGAGPVRVVARDAGEAVAIDVIDHGPGITVPNGELFTRLAEAATGHGIGLALARRLAEAENGRLHLSRRCPPTFTLLVPAQRDAPSQPPIAVGPDTRG
jgi:signal transduction histidine kinase